MTRTEPEARVSAGRPTRRASGEDKTLRRTAAICALAISAALFAGGCGDGDGDGVPASGYVDATQIRVPAKVAGQILETPFEEGQAVKAGTVLARIDTVDTSLQLAAARGDRDRSSAEYRLRLAGSRREDIAQAQAQVDKARAERESADRDLKRMEELFAAGSTTEKARDDAVTRQSLANASLAAAKEQLQRLVAGSRLEEIEGARAALQAAEARVAQLEQRMRDAVIVSPADGVVTERLLESGEWIAPGMPVAVVTELRRPWLNAWVGEPDLGRIRIGSEAEVTTDAGETRTGRVSFISPDAEFTPKNIQTRDERIKLVYRVKIELPNEDGIFKPGMPAQARIHASGAAGGEERS